MAPLDPDAVARPNWLPLTILGSQVGAVALLTGHIAKTIYRAARALPPSAETRAQHSVRKRNAAIFSVLALLSLASVTTFAVVWRLLDYFEWADKGNHGSPDGIWTGWYGTGDESVGRWRLGDWWADINYIDDSYAKVLASPEAFLYLYQHFTGIAAAAIFFGVEGRRRNLPMKTILAFVALSSISSLGLSLNLFFVTMLFTPLAVHEDHSHRHDVLFTPKPAVFYIPVLLAFALEQSLPHLLARRADLTLFRAAYALIPAFLAFIPEFAPRRWGTRHASKAAAHRAYVPVFHMLGLIAAAVTWKQFVFMAFVHTPPEPNVFVSAYDSFRNSISRHAYEKPSRFRQGLGNTAQALKSVSSHPVTSVTSLDILFTALSLLAWTFVRNLDVGDLLDNSVLAYFRDAKKSAEGERVIDRAGSVPKLQNAAPSENHAEDIEVKTPRRRGRPRKSSITATTTSRTPSAVAGSAALRRSTRRRTGNTSADSYDEGRADADASYEPPAQTRRSWEHTEIDRAGTAATEEELLEGGEATALALCITFFGGLGQVAAAVLGAEVTGGV